LTIVIDYQLVGSHISAVSKAAYLLMHARRGERVAAAAAAPPSEPSEGGGGGGGAPGLVAWPDYAGANAQGGGSYIFGKMPGGAWDRHSQGSEWLGMP
jgi:hypothetical protein